MFHTTCCLIRKRIQFDDEIHDKLLEKQNELKQIVPSTTLSNVVNYYIKSAIKKD